MGDLIAKATAALKGAEVLALDIETTGLTFWDEEIKTLAVSNGEKHFVFTEVEHWHEPEDRTRFVQFLKEVIYASRLLVHNYMFDSQFVYHTFPEAGWPPDVWDTLIAERLLTAGLRDFKFQYLKCDLESTLSRRFDVALDKEWQTWFVGKRGELIPRADLPKEVMHYCVMDVEFLPQLYYMQEEEIRTQFQEDVWEVEMAALPAFAKMKYRGLPVDLDAFLLLFDNDDPERGPLGVKQDRLKVEAKLVEMLTEHVFWKRLEKYDAKKAAFDAYCAMEQAEVARLRAEWAQAMELLDLDDTWHARNWHDLKPHTNPKFEGWFQGEKRYVDHHMVAWRKTVKRPENPKEPDRSKPINLGSPEQVAAAFESLGLELPNTRKNTLKGALVKLPKGEVRDVIIAMTEWRKLKKREDAFGNVLPKYLDDQLTLHGNLNPYGTRTGRPSCEKPNMMQMPKLKEFRQCFKARAGFHIVRLDYSQMELRIVAEMSGDEVMLDIFRSGRDIHTATAALIFGKPYEEIDPDGDERNKVAKILNFAILYGMHVKSLYATFLAAGLDTTLEETQGFWDGWRSGFAAASAWIERSGREGVERKYSTTLLGRRQRFRLPKSAERWEVAKAQRVAANHRVQGSNADITKLAMMLAQPRLEELGGSLLLNIYDELVAEAPVETSEEAMHVLAACMIAAARTVLHVVEIEVDGEVSDNWAGVNPVVTIKGE